MDTWPLTGPIVHWDAHQQRSARRGAVMVDQRTPARRSGGLFMSVLGGLLLIAALVAVIAFRVQLWHFLQWLGRSISTWATDWVPDHRDQTGAMVAFAVVAFLINWVAHVRGRLRAWVFSVVVELGLWLLFWLGLGVPPLNELFNLNLPALATRDVWLSGVIVVAVTGVLFWFLEVREEWRKYRHRLTVDDA
jgi:hypothetical protein